MISVAAPARNFVGGGQIGCDYQFASNWMIGIQGMYDYGRISSSHVVPTAFAGAPVGSFQSVDQARDMWTVTGRVGYLFIPQLLGYVKGGGAWTRVDQAINGTVPVFFNSENAFGVNRSGWTVGGGLEWMFAPGWSVFGEFNYMDFGSKNVNFVKAPGTIAVRRRGRCSHQARGRAVPGGRELQVQFRWPDHRQVLSTALPETN